jgi:hypothetical protein
MAARRRQVTSIPARLVDLVLLGPADDRRQLQDSPILGDVWLAYAAEPLARHDLLITPHRQTTAANVAHQIARRLKIGQKKPERAQIAYLQGLVAARLSLPELLRVIVPLTYWWSVRHIRDSWTQFKKRKDLADMLRELLQSLQDGHRAGKAVVYENFTAVQRYLTLAGILLWARDGIPAARSSRRGAAKPDPVSAAEDILKLAVNDINTIVDKLFTLYGLILKTDADGKSGAELIFQVSLNRRAAPALTRSVPAVKGDAARTLFKVDTRKIAWAVLDSGIDRDHHAFRDDAGKSRVKGTFDFTRIRQICSIDNDNIDAAELASLVKEVGEPAAKVKQWLKDLRDNAERERPIAWDVAEKLLRREPPPELTSPHGTHVAGIIGARKPAEGYDGATYADGMCPEIQLYDFRVLAKTTEDTEFAIIGALQYIRYINERHSYTTIHGANLSLSIPHNVRNYACGRTPVCVECQRLVEAGVVVVAAAGNRGYQRFQTEEGLFDNYAAFSITDPGNAEDVITVGATHGNWPHTYGVSFFSSRGPTGDGRPKPDLVAPGERVEAPFPNREVGAESGTSMAAPHVSGAAAMLMARYPELIGNPRRIKRILCDTATDLNRDRSFQGFGMLDVLRAFQSL